MRAVLLLGLVLALAGHMAAAGPGYGVQYRPYYAYPPQAAYGQYPRPAPMPVYAYGYRPSPATPIGVPGARSPAVAPAVRPRSQPEPDAAPITAPARLAPRPVEASTPEPDPISAEPAMEPANPVTTENTEQAFFDALRPIVEAENRRLAGVRREIQGWFDRLDAGGSLDDAEAGRLQALARRYRVKSDPAGGVEARAELLRKLDIIPVSLALAQAANESAWGRSRFAREGLNLFGIWTYDPAKGIVPRDRPAGERHLVRRFDSIEDSVRHYMRTLNSHPAYRPLRQIRARQRALGGPLDGYELAAGLEKYSAKGEAYVRMIRALIDDYGLAGLDRSGLEG